MMENYHSEFINTLLKQAVNTKGRYSSVHHKLLKRGDLVLLVEKMSKRNNYPMGRILAVEENSIGEVTAAHILRGDTGEKVYRHSTSLIHLLSVDNEPSDEEISTTDKPVPAPKRQRRKAAKKCLQRLKTSLNS